MDYAIGYCILYIRTLPSTIHNFDLMTLIFMLWLLLLTVNIFYILTIIENDKPN